MVGAPHRVADQVLVALMAIADVGMRVGHPRGGEMRCREMVNRGGMGDNARRRQVPDRKPARHRVEGREAVDTTTAAHVETTPTHVEPATAHVKTAPTSASTST